jgi:hypothetical protein
MTRLFKYMFKDLVHRVRYTACTVLAGNTQKYVPSYIIFPEKAGVRMPRLTNVRCIYDARGVTCSSEPS